MPFTDIAVDLGAKMVKNIAALGALQAATAIFPEGTFHTAIAEALRTKTTLVPVNEAAFDRGIAACREAMG